MDLICIQESNLDSSFSFWIPGFSALRSNCTHSRSGILSPDDPHAGGDIIIFVRQGLSLSKHSISSFFSFDPCSNYAGVNILPTNSSSLSFLNVYAPPIRSSSTNSRTGPFSFDSSLLQKFLHSGGLQLLSYLWDSKGTSDCHEGKIFYWVISSDLLPLNVPETPTLLHRSSSNCPSPFISFLSRLLLLLRGALGLGL